MAYWYPEGTWPRPPATCESQGVRCQLEDRTRVLHDIKFCFIGNLRSEQQEAADKILAKRFGVAQMPTGAGKTVVALYAVAMRGQPALVIVHTKELLYQWQQAAQLFLGLDKSKIGLLGDGHSDLGKPLTIAIVNSLYTRAEQYREQTGFLIVDECHRVPSRTFSEAVSRFDSRFMLGLSATPQRRDELTRLIYLFLGDRVCKVSHMKLQASGQIMGADLVVRGDGVRLPLRR